MENVYRARSVHALQASDREIIGTKIIVSGQGAVYEEDAFVSVVVLRNQADPETALLLTSRQAAQLGALLIGYSQAVDHEVAEILTMLREEAQASAAGASVQPSQRSGVHA